jgi:serine/threonine protein kinase
VVNESAPAGIGFVAHYNLIERLDFAGPGELFRARDTHLGRTVAVRLLPSEFPRDAEARGRFLEEARSLAALSHPNITTLFDVGEHDGRVYLVFEHLKGQSLRAEMAGRPMNVRRAVELGVQIADAVAGAHAAGFAGGGFTPDSIAITAKGRAKIPVFESAAHSGFDPDDPAMRHPDYDSPEEAGGQPTDERSDVYTVGAILYEMLTTRRPLHRGSAAPSASNRNVPAVVDEVVLKAVAPNAASRVQSAATLAAELRIAATTFDARTGAGEEEGHLESRETSVGRVLVLSIAILLGLGLLALWLVAR